MTANQIQYWRNLETERSNKAREAETERYNRASVAEQQRANLAKEAENVRHNKATEGVAISDTAQGWVSTIVGKDGVLGVVKDVGKALGTAQQLAMFA